MITDYKDWSNGWVKAGQNISYLREGIWYYERVVKRDLGHWVYDWHETITTGTESGPEVPALLEITRGYNAASNQNQVWQLIFGIKGQVYIYVELPTDTHRHGIPKRPKPGTVQWDVSHFTEEMSPFITPSFITEHYMMRPDTQQICLSAYLPEAAYVRSGMTDVKLNFMINKMITERIGTVTAGVQSPSRPRFSGLLDKLYKCLIPCRPITLTPVRAPAEAPGGE